jgi:hypothetical protein
LFYEGDVVKTSKRVAKEGWGTAIGHGTQGLTPVVMESGSLSSEKKEDGVEKTERAS